MISIINKDPSSPIEYGFEVESIVVRRESPFQEILVVDTAVMGRMLILDGAVQLVTGDEFFYHEMAAHVILHAHPDPRSVAVIGGGDCAAAREVLKHELVESVCVVEIDEDIINISRDHLPWASAALGDSRLEIEIKDGAEFMKERGRGFDVIIVDAGDYVGFARSLLTVDFFRDAMECLNDGGMLVTHSGSLHFHRDTVVEIQENLKSSFPVVDLYTTTVPSFPGNWWSFSIASKDREVRSPVRPLEVPVRYYDEEVHKQSFLTTGLYRKLLENRLDWGTD